MGCMVVFVENLLLYEKSVSENPRLTPEKMSVIPLLRRRHASAPAGYNSVLASPDFREDQWIIFCHDRLEFLDDPLPALESADPECLYGVFGIHSGTNEDGHLFSEYVGRVREYSSTATETVYGTPPAALPESLEAVGLNCLIAHGSLLRRLGLRFDEELAEAFFVEDFCLRARAGHGVAVRLLPLAVRLLGTFSQLSDRVTFGEAFARFSAKHAAARAGTPDGGREALLLRSEAPADGSAYHAHIKTLGANDAFALAAGFLKPGGRLLDVGCASGDLGVFFKKTLQMEVWGMEYNESALAVAAEQAVYRQLHQVDLQTFSPAEFREYYGFFDHLFLGDVLEHLVNPQDALRKCALFVKPGGSLIASVPNAAHSYVIGNLLACDFPYSRDGILDKTHLRFFTWKTLAALFAGASLKVVKATATFTAPGRPARWDIAEALPEAAYDLLSSNRHFFVVQYVSVLELSDDSEEELLRQNLDMLHGAPENNPRAWAATAPGRSAFRRRKTAAEEKRG